MERATAFRLTQGLYYLALGTWFGALVMLVIAAGTTFHVIEAYTFTLHAGPGGIAVDEPALADEAARIIAGSIVGEAIEGLTWVQGICAAVAMLCLLLHTTVFRCRLAKAGRSRANVLRTLLVLGPVVVLLLNVLWINPGVWQARGAMYDSGRSADQRVEARRSFEQYHRLSERTTGGAALMLAVAVLASPFAFRVTPAPAVVERPLSAAGAAAPRPGTIDYD